MAVKSRTTTRTTASPTVPTTTTTPPAPLWTELGCYPDASIHPLQTQMPFIDKMTRKKCEDVCWDAGYSYAGFKAGNECWCGHFVDGDWNLADCTTPCSGNSSEICGGDDVFNAVEGNEPYIYYTSTTTPLTTSTTTTSSSSPASETAFVLMSHYHNDCTGEVSNEVLVRSGTNGFCVATG